MLEVLFLPKYTQSQKTAFLFLTFIFFLLCCVCLLNRENDKFNVNYEGQDFYVDQSVENAIFDLSNHMETYNNKDGHYIYLDNLLFEPGTYDFDFQYATEFDNCNFVISSKNMLNSDNKNNITIYSQALNPQESELKASFTINQNVDDVTIAVVPAKGSDFAVGRLTVTSEDVVMNDAFIFIFLYFIVYLILIYIVFTKKEFTKPTLLYNTQISSKRTIYAVFFIMVTLSLFIIYPLYNVKVIGGYDIIFHLSRIEGIKSGLLSGQFPVRIHPDHLNQYGYTNSIFYPELFLYFPAILRILGMSLKNSYLVFIFCINLLTCFISFISFNGFFKSRYAATLCTVLYALNPYRLTNLYERSAIGEFIAMSFLPLIFYGLYSVIFGDKRKWPCLVIGATCLLQSHVLSVEIVAFYCIIICLFSVKHIFNKQKRYLTIIKSAVVIILLNLWFIVPFLLMTFQLQIAVFERNPLLSTNHILFLNEMFSFNFLLTHRKNQTGASNTGLGIVFLVMLALFILYVIMFYKKSEKHDKLIKIGIFCTFTSAITVWLTTYIFPWDKVQQIQAISKIVGSLQFVNRLMIVVMLLFTIIAGIVLILFTKNNISRPIAVFCISIIAVIASWAYLDNVAIYSPYDDLGSKSQINLEHDINSSIALGEYIPANSSVIDILTRGTALTHENENINISNVKRKGSIITFNYNIENYDSSQIYEVVAPLTFYPSYIVTIDGKNYETSIAEGNYVKFALPKESGQVTVKYSQPLTFTLFDIISLITTIIFIIFLVDKNNFIKSKFKNVFYKENLKLQNKKAVAITASK